MTQRECEKQLIYLIERAYKLLKVYNPEATHIDMFATNDGCCVYGFTGKAEDHTIIIDGFKSAGGNFRFGKEATA